MPYVAELSATGQGSSVRDLTFNPEPGPNTMSDPPVASDMGRVYATVGK